MFEGCGALTGAGAGRYFEVTTQQWKPTGVYVEKRTFSGHQPRRNVHPSLSEVRTFGDFSTIPFVFSGAVYSAPFPEGIRLSTILASESIEQKISLLEDIVLSIQGIDDSLRGKGQSPIPTREYFDVFFALEKSAFRNWWLALDGNWPAAESAILELLKGGPEVEMCVGTIRGRDILLSGRRKSIFVGDSWFCGSTFLSLMPLLSECFENAVRSQQLDKFEEFSRRIEPYFKHTALCVFCGLVAHSAQCFLVDKTNTQWQILARVALFVKERYL